MKSMELSKWLHPLRLISVGFSFPRFLTQLLLSWDPLSLDTYLPSPADCVVCGSFYPSSLTTEDWGFIFY